MKHVKGFFILGVLSLLIACSNDKTPSDEQAVIVHFKYHSSDTIPLLTLEKELEQILVSKSIGEFDGHSLSEDGSDDVLYMYGPNARRIFNEVKFVLMKQPFMDGAEVTVKYGAQDDEEQQEIYILKYSKGKVR